MKKNGNSIIASIVAIILSIITSICILLTTNKTFFKNVYVDVQNQVIFIPKYSYFKEECCMTAAIFYSLRSENTLKKEINEYMKDFEYFNDESTYGYMKDDLFIQSYEVIDNGLYRKIIITY